MSGPQQRWRQQLTRLLEAQRVRVSSAEALPQFAVLGVICGILAALVMMAFRGLIDLGQSLLIGRPDAFEALPLEWRFALPIIGALIVALIFSRLSDLARNVGVVHVLERLAYHQARLPLRSAVVQFVSAALLLIFGLSVGREGPAVHLGAASASLTGQFLRLPNNSLRILAGCGVAAAIAASFNTPLAGVAFAMEVVLMEYTVVGFAPVILAAVSATAVTRMAYGAAPAFAVPALTMNSLWELPYVLAMGLVIGLLAATFVAMVDRTARHTKTWPFWLRAMAAGVLTGVLAMPAPEIMGVGYDTVNATLLGTVAVSTLVLIVVFKLLATGLTIGLGMPGGLIGPLVVIGAAAGAGLGVLGGWLVPAHASSPTLYALIGLGAMMAGALHAPLAALTAMLELTGNPNIIWPGMLAVIAAYGVSRVAFRQQPMFITLMRARGLDYHHDPILQTLRRIGVAAVMDSHVVALPRQAARRAVESALSGNPAWILVQGSERPVALLSAMDLARQLMEAPQAQNLDLLELPADRLQLAGVALEATLQEALEIMDAQNVDALYVARISDYDGDSAYGVLTRADIHKHYRYGS